MFVDICDVLAMRKLDRRGPKIRDHDSERRSAFYLVYSCRDETRMLAEKLLPSLDYDEAVCLGCDQNGVLGSGYQRCRIMENDLVRRTPRGWYVFLPLRQGN